MKYLKSFNESLDKDWVAYEELTEEEWVNKARNRDNQEDFTHVENEEIRRFFPVGYIIRKDFDRSYESKSSVLIGLQDEFCNALFVNIIKVKDNWYYVNYFPRSASDSDMGIKFFKCDEFDGLIKLLGEKKLGEKYK